MATDFLPQDRRRSRRLTPRVPFRIQCRVRLVDPSSGVGQTVLGETVNVSRGGLSIQLGVDVPLGTWAETLLPHRNGDPVFVCGTVVRRRRVLATCYEIGIKTDRWGVYV